MTWELICDDCFKILPTMVRAGMKFDLIVLDPPFMNWDLYLHGERIKVKKPNYFYLARLSYQLLKESGVVALFGKQPQLIKDWKHFDRYFEVMHEFVLIKRRPTMPTGEYHPTLAHENLWILKRKGTKTTETKVSYLRGARKIGTDVAKFGKHGYMRIRSFDGDDKEYNLYEGRLSSVIMRGQVTEQDLEYLGHPTQKPLELMRKIIVATTEEGDIILDPFAGSGTTLAAAIIERRNVIGIEINPKFCEIIRKRCKQIEEGITKWLEQ